jgi:hypothetical protein
MPEDNLCVRHVPALSKSTGQQKLEPFGCDGRWQDRGVFSVARDVKWGDEGPEHLADGCHGILACRSMFGRWQSLLLALWRALAFTLAFSWETLGLSTRVGMLASTKLITERIVAVCLR